MPYLNLDLDYFDHPKTKRLIGLLGAGAEIFPVRLWCFCGKYQPESGKLTAYSMAEIEGIAGWTGEPGKMVEAMVQIGFLDKKGDRHFIHDWKDHAGHLKAFHERAVAANKVRWGKLKVKTSSLKDSLKDPTRNPKPPPKESPSLTNLSTPKELNLKAAALPVDSVDNSKPEETAMDQIGLIKMLKIKFFEKFKTHPEPWFVKCANALDRGTPPPEVQIRFFEKIIESNCEEPYPYAIKTELLKIVWESFNAEKRTEENNREKIKPVGQVLSKILSGGGPEGQ